MIEVTASGVIPRRVKMPFAATGKRPGWGETAGLIQITGLRPEIADARDDVPFASPPQNLPSLPIAALLLSSNLAGQPAWSRARSALMVRGSYLGRPSGGGGALAR